MIKLHVNSPCFVKRTLPDRPSDAGCSISQQPDAFSTHRSSTVLPWQPSNECNARFQNLRNESWPTAAAAAASQSRAFYYECIIASIRVLLAFMFTSCSTSDDFNGAVVPNAVVCHAARMMSARAVSYARTALSVYLWNSYHTASNK